MNEHAETRLVEPLQIRVFPPLLRDNCQDDSSLNLPSRGLTLAGLGTSAARADFAGPRSGSYCSEPGIPVTSRGNPVGEQSAGRRTAPAGEATLRPYVSRGFGDKSASEGFVCDAVSAKLAASSPIRPATLFWDRALHLQERACVLESGGAAGKPRGKVGSPPSRKQLGRAPERGGAAHCRASAASRLAACSAGRPCLAKTARRFDQATRLLRRQIAPLARRSPTRPLIKCPTASRVHAAGSDSAAWPLAVQARHGQAFMGAQQRLFRKSARRN